jgi:hypothetical protein
MSHDLIGPSGDQFLAQITTQVLHDPLRSFAPVSRAIKECKRDLKTNFNPERHELILPRIKEALSAVETLDAIINSGVVVPHELIFELLRILQFTIATQKKSEDENAATMRGGLALFDFEIDSAGADLGMWDETPKHPMVVAFAVQRLNITRTFTPSLAELASACRSAHYHLRIALKDVLDWLDRFNYLDARLAMKTRESHDAWARSLTLEKIATIEAIDELLCHFKRTITREFDTDRLQDAEPKKYPLREKFFAAIKNKLALGEEPTLSDEEVEIIAASCGWESWRSREAREQEQAERYREEERLRKEQERLEKERERLWEKRRHQCAFCSKSEKAVVQLFGINLSAYRPVLSQKPVAICNECLDTDPAAKLTPSRSLPPRPQRQLACSFCGATKPAVRDNGIDAICRDCFQAHVEQWKSWSHPIVDFFIGAKGKLTDEFAKAKAEGFNALVELHAQEGGKKAIVLQIAGYEDDYGQPLYSDDAAEVAAYVRSWARFAKLDLKRAVQLFGPETWGGNRLPETLHFLMMCDAIGEFREKYDEASLDECVELAVKLCAERGRES